ncbi:MAG: DNRLRE domain-containing protein [Phycisphaerae bacterium]|nr:DNRLRE domain-containing protein [Phycisphaerae bacterium]
MKNVLLALVMVALLVGAQTAVADTVSFQQGVVNDFSGGSAYTGTEDNYTYSPTASQNHGGNQTICVRIADAAQGGMRTTLLRFDLTSLAGKTITSAKLKLRAYTTTHTATDISLHAIVAANKDWVEGTTASGTQAGSSCWSHAQYSTSAWAGGSNGCGVVGTDCGTAIDTVPTAPASGAVDEWDITDATTIALMNTWITSHDDNAGFVLKCATGWAAYRSSEYGTVSARPELEITYTPEPATMTLLLLGLPLALRRRRK